MKIIAIFALLLATTLCVWEYPCVNPYYHNSTEPYYKYYQCSDYNNHKHNDCQTLCTNAGCLSACNEQFRKFACCCENELMGSFQSSMCNDLSPSICFPFWSAC